MNTDISKSVSAPTIRRDADTITLLSGIIRLTVDTLKNLEGAGLSNTANNDFSEVSLVNLVTCRLQNAIVEKRRNG